MKLTNTAVTLLATVLFAVASQQVTANEVDGKTEYGANCAACHQLTGAGVPPAFPALKGSKIVNNKDSSEQIAVVLNGKPQTAMLPFARLSDEQLAAIISYTRTSWGNASGEVTADEIKVLRK